MSDLTFRDYIAQKLIADCERGVRCSPGGQSYEECIAANDTADVKARIDTFDTGIKEGRLGYDPDAAERALAATKEYPCDQGIELLKLSNSVLTGLVPEGSDCYAHVECAEVDTTLSGNRYCVDGCTFLTGETGQKGTCQESPISTGACP